ncbi:alpha-(1,3)-fucosyltransferase C-like [Anticarsia gemmatalis]|uniref:alpha-(1,3)-fucosyltransferase C-like n=1 Tax=Anticarsia gemmatalis TaxID=129554 RepID=UPI003F75FEFD
MRKTVYLTFSIMFLTLSSNFNENSALTTTFNIRVEEETDIKPLDNTELKYILLWTELRDSVPFCDLLEGRETFKSRNCSFTNCIVTADKKLLDVSLFDAVVFNAPEVTYMNDYELPSKRSQSQKYVFASIESSDYYPICSTRFEGYFNWTWTYRLESEVRWGYIVIRDSEGNVVGPKNEMHWLGLHEMDRVSPEIKKQLQNKTRAAAWFVSNCLTYSHRENVADALQEALKPYNLDLDIYGSCNSLKCPRKNAKHCNRRIQLSYYFYLAFENSLSEDYVTEKLLTALQNYAVPIVFGGANYSKFLPPGSYLDAKELSADKLARKMYRLIKKPELYAQYFRWRNHYSYHKTTDSPETDEYCRMCALLNDNVTMKTKSVVQNLREWWDPPQPTAASCVLKN